MTDRIDTIMTEVANCSRSRASINRQLIISDEQLDGSGDPPNDRKDVVNTSQGYSAILQYSPWR
ncbi:hypothetical protein O9992_16395 [Vibrio lentus]|nr:hypothetical protein [Vibrio lentus]